LVKIDPDNLKEFRDLADREDYDALDYWYKRLL